MVSKTPIIRFDSGVIYLVDKVFATMDEISKAIERHPATHTPWGPIVPQKPPAGSDRFVSVDLVAELLEKEKNKGSPGSH